MYRCFLFVIGTKDCSSTSEPPRLARKLQNKRGVSPSCSPLHFNPGNLARVLPALDAAAKQNSPPAWLYVELSFT
jgi:hypothetical protein